mmetsp:Transcript_73918/g.214117  ORF Transcript_73918/g.214117 Transcript_73918/m.214117 type:complete len:420 (-) Transcript_73918:68-1327(-)
MFVYMLLRSRFLAFFTASRASGRIIRRRFGNPRAAKGGETSGRPMDACNLFRTCSIRHSARVQCTLATSIVPRNMPGETSMSGEFGTTTAKSSAIGAMSGAVVRGAGGRSNPCITPRGGFGLRPLPPTSGALANCSPGSALPAPSDCKEAAMARVKPGGSNMPKADGIPVASPLACAASPHAGAGGEAARPPGPPLPPLPDRRPELAGEGAKGSGPNGKRTGIGNFDKSVAPPAAASPPRSRARLRLSPLRPPLSRGDAEALRLSPNTEGEVVEAPGEDGPGIQEFAFQLCCHAPSPVAPHAAEAHKSSATCVPSAIGSHALPEDAAAAVLAAAKACHSMQSLRNLCIVSSVLYFHCSKSWMCCWRRSISMWIGHWPWLGPMEAMEFQSPSSPSQHMAACHAAMSCAEAYDAVNIVGPR